MDSKRNCLQVPFQTPWGGDCVGSLARPAALWAKTSTLLLSWPTINYQLINTSVDMTNVIFKNKTWHSWVNKHKIIFQSKSNITLKKIHMHTVPNKYSNHTTNFSNARVGKWSISAMQITCSILGHFELIDQNPHQIGWLSLVLAPPCVTSGRHDQNLKKKKNLLKCCQ